MSIVQALDTPKATDVSVQYLGGISPIVEGEVITSGLAENPITIDDLFEEINYDEGKDDEAWE